jgi:hypothetical protein
MRDMLNVKCHREARNIALAEDVKGYRIRVM